MQKILLLFDIDGTLLLTGGVGKIALEEAFKQQFGIANCWEELDPHGKTDPAIFDEIARRELGRLLTNTEFDQLMHGYEFLFKKHIKQASRFELMPGIVSLLEYLSQQENIFLALGTGNFEGAGRMKLARGGINHYFKAGGFGRDARERHKILMAAVIHSEEVFGQKFDNNRIFVIGDTEYDIIAANRTGLRSIAVLTNGRTEKHFEADSPDFILNDLTNIPLFMECLNSIRSSQS